jgi:hypothetical protein
MVALRSERFAIVNDIDVSRDSVGTARRGDSAADPDAPDRYESSTRAAA